MSTDSVSPPRRRMIGARGWSRHAGVRKPALCTIPAQYQTTKRRKPNQERLAQEKRARPLRFSEWFCGHAH